MSHRSGYPHVYHYENAYHISDSHPKIRNNLPEVMTINIYLAKNTRGGELTPLLYRQQLQLSPGDSSDLNIPDDFTFASFQINGISGFYQLRYILSGQNFRVTTRDIIQPENFVYALRTI